MLVIITPCCKSPEATSFYHFLSPFNHNFLMLSNTRRGSENWVRKKEACYFKLPIKNHCGKIKE